MYKRQGQGVLRAVFFGGEAVKDNLFVCLFLVLQDDNTPWLSALFPSSKLAMVDQLFPASHPFWPSSLTVKEI